MILAADLFRFYRRFLWMVLTIYWITLVVGSAARHLAWMRSQRYGRLAGKYLLVQALRVRLRRHWLEVLQCLGLVALFVLVWAMHWLIECVLP